MKRTVLTRNPDRKQKQIRRLLTKKRKQKPKGRKRNKKPRTKQTKRPQNKRQLLH